MQEIDNLYIYEFADGFFRYANEVPSAILEGMTWRKNLSHPHWAHEESMPYSLIWKSVIYDYGGTYFAPVKDAVGTSLDTSGQWQTLGNTFPLARLSTTDPDVLTVSWKFFPKNWNRYVLLEKAPPKGPHVAHFQKYSFEHLSGDTRLGGGKVSADARRARYRFSVEGQKDGDILSNLIDQVEAHVKQIRVTIAKGRSDILQSPPCKYSLPDKQYFEHDYQNGADLSEGELAKWMEEHKAALRPESADIDIFLPGACPECGGMTHFIQSGFWVCGDCDHAWKEPDAETEENPETGQRIENIFELAEFQDSHGHQIIAPGYQEKKARRGNRKDPLLSWPEELTLIKRLYPQYTFKEHPDRATAERLILGRYYYRQLGGTDKSIAAQLKRSGWTAVSPSAIKRDRQRLDTIILRVLQLNADSGAYFTLPEVADKTGIPQSQIILWLKSGWIEGTSIDAEGEELEIYPWWILSLKQMVTLAEKWENQAQPIVL